LWVSGKRHPLFLLKSLFFRALLKTTNEVWFCTQRTKIRGISFLLVLSLPFSPRTGTNVFVQADGWKIECYCPAAAHGCGGPGGYHQTQAQSACQGEQEESPVCPAAAGLKPVQCTLLLLFYRVEEARTLETKQGSIRPESFTAWANKRGLHGKLARRDTSGQSLPYDAAKVFFLPPPSKI